MYRYERSTKTMQVISTWHLLKNKDMGYSSQLQSFELNTRTKILWPLNLSATKRSNKQYNYDTEENKNKKYRIPWIYVLWNNIQTPFGVQI